MIWGSIPHNSAYYPMGFKLSSKLSFRGESARGPDIHDVGHPGRCAGLVAFFAGGLGFRVYSTALN